MTTEQYVDELASRFVKLQDQMMRLSQLVHELVQAQQASNKAVTERLDAVEVKIKSLEEASHDQR